MGLINLEKESDRFGLCPVCKSNDGCLSVGRSHFFYCAEHRVFWCVGSNLFSSWREMTEEDFKRNSDLLDGYKEVEPFVWPETLEARKKACKELDELIKRQEAQRLKAGWPEDDCPF